MNQFTIGQKQISVYPCDEPDRPVIYLNTFAGEGEQVLRLLRDDGCPPFTLVSVSSLDWNHDMLPWEIPPVFKNADPCTGGADDKRACTVAGNRRVFPCRTLCPVFTVPD